MTAKRKFIITFTAAHLCFAAGIFLAFSGVFA